jgi:DNA-binding NtrC family response regulator
VSIPARSLVVKVDATHHRLDCYSKYLIENGFQVVNASTIKEGIKLARRCRPDLIIAVDNYKSGLDAGQWLEIQHSDSEPTLAMTPLLIVADAGRAERLRLHELPDRIKVLERPLPPEALSDEANQILMAWDF